MTQFTTRDALLRSSNDVPEPRPRGRQRDDRASEAAERSGRAEMAVSVEDDAELVMDLCHT